MNERLSALKAMCFGTDRDRRNERRLVFWSLIWMGSWVGLKLAADGGSFGAWSTTAAAGCALLGVGPFHAYRRFLREADELRRRIELNALALAFGVGIVGGTSYEFFEVTHLLADAELVHVLLAMLLAYVVGVFAGFRRYR